AGMNSNHDKELQRLLCYHYTTGQNRNKASFPTSHAQRKSDSQTVHPPALAGIVRCAVRAAFSRATCRSLADQRASVPPAGRGRGRRSAPIPTKPPPGIG